MCLTVENNAKIKTATKDIMVFKLGQIDDYDGTFRVSTRNYLYNKGELQKDKMDISIGRDYSVDNGYHSWKHSRRRDYPTNGIFYIPIGATYIEGIQYDGNKGFVSSDIVYFGEDTFFRRWGIRLGIIKLH